MDTYITIWIEILFITHLASNLVPTSRQSKHDSLWGGKWINWSLTTMWWIWWNELAQDIVGTHLVGRKDCQGTENWPSCLEHRT